MMYAPIPVNECEKKAIAARREAVFARSAAARWEHLQLARMWDEIARSMRNNGLADIIST